MILNVSKTGIDRFKGKIYFYSSNMDAKYLKCGDIVHCTTVIWEDMIGKIISKDGVTCDISFKDKTLIFFPYESIESKLSPEEKFAWYMES